MPSAFTLSASAFARPLPALLFVLVEPGVHGLFLRRPFVGQFQGFAHGLQEVTKRLWAAVEEHWNRERRAGAWPTGPAPCGTCSPSLVFRSTSRPWPARF